MSRTGGLVAAVPLVFLLLFGVVVAVVVVAAVSGGRRRQERRARLLQWAASRAFAYAAGDPALVTAFPGTPFGQGRSRRAVEAVRGTWAGRPALAFDYSWVTDGGEDSTTHWAAVVAINLPVQLPQLFVRPKGLGGKLWDAVSGGPDIVLADPVFTSTYRVRAADPRFAYDVLTPATTARLLADEPCAWRTSGSWLVLWRAGHNEPALLERRLTLLTAIADGIPPPVWAKLGWHPPVPPASGE